ncbi:hypothetical protein CCACVL1_03295, partial [Corchorus capsularis]
ALFCYLCLDYFVTALQWCLDSGVLLLL